MRERGGGGGSCSKGVRDGCSLPLSLGWSVEFLTLFWCPRASRFRGRRISHRVVRACYVEQYENGEVCWKWPMLLRSACFGAHELSPLHGARLAFFMVFFCHFFFCHLLLSFVPLTGCVKRPGADGENGDAAALCGRVQRPGRALPRAVRVHPRLDDEGAAPAPEVISRSCCAGRRGVEPVSPGLVHRVSRPSSFEMTKRGVMGRNTPHELCLLPHPLVVIGACFGLGRWTKVSCLAFFSRGCRKMRSNDWKISLQRSRRGWLFCRSFPSKPHDLLRTIFYFWFRTPSPLQALLLLSHDWLADPSGGVFAP